jgi:hypothetical protein
VNVRGAHEIASSDTARVSLLENPDPAARAFHHVQCHVPLNAPRDTL